MSYQYQKLFEPVKIGSLEIKNRFGMAPMGPLGLAMLMEEIWEREAAKEIRVGHSKKY